MRPLLFLRSLLTKLWQALCAAFGSALERLFSIKPLTRRQSQCAGACIPFPLLAAFYFNSHEGPCKGVLLGLCALIPTAFLIAEAWEWAETYDWRDLHFRLTDFLYDSTID